MDADALALDAPPATPRTDTWGLHKDAGTWCITAAVSPEIQTAAGVNGWLADAVQATFVAFASFARPWRLDFASIAEPAVPPVILDWDPREDPEEFMSRAVAAIRAYPAPIYAVNIAVDVAAFVRTADSQDRPVRAWLRLPSQIRIWSPYAGATPSLCLDLDHTLFAPISGDLDDNRELFALNRPLLKEALGRWKAHFGPITDFQGFPAADAYGLLPEDPDDLGNTWQGEVRPPHR